MDDRSALRRAMLEEIARRAPAPTNVENLRQALYLQGRRLEDGRIIAECAELETAGYLVNLKHALDPVYRGVTMAARKQLDMSVKLDPAIWGDNAL